MANDVDDLIGDEAETKKPAKKAAAKPAAKPAAKAEAKKAPAKKEAAKPAAKGKPAAKAPAKAAAKPAKKAAKKEAADPTESTSPVVQALLKVKKAISYADFAEKNDFNIRSVRRTARELRDGGHIELEKDGQTVMIKPAV